MAFESQKALDTPALGCFKRHNSSKPLLPELSVALVARTNNSHARLTTMLLPTEHLGRSGVAFVINWPIISNVAKYNAKELIRKHRTVIVDFSPARSRLRGSLIELQWKTKDLLNKRTCLNKRAVRRWRRHNRALKSPVEPSQTGTRMG